MLPPEAHGTTDALVQSLVPEIFRQVVAEISRQPVEKSGDRAKKSKKAKDAAEPDDVESSPADSTDSELTDSSSDDTIVPAPKRKKRMRINGKKRFSRDSLPQFALSFSVPKSTKKDVLEGEFVSLYKLLPGSDGKNGDVVSTIDEDGNVRLAVSDSRKDKKLSRQPLEIQQLILALLKYKQIIGDVSERKVAHIDSYIANIILLCNKYKGLAYWYYHVYFWDKVSEYGVVTGRKSVFLFTVTMRELFLLSTKVIKTKFLLLTC